MPLSTTPAILGLLAEPVRWQLVTELGRSDRRVSELVQLVDRPQNLVSYHLRELRDAGIVTARRSSADGRDVYYRADLARCRALLDEAGMSLGPRRPDRHASRRRSRVLFLCTGNSARSQIAEALTQARSAGAVEARSAGSHPKPLHPGAVRVMAARGIDISGRSTKSFTRFSRQRFDRVVTLCDKVREVCPEFPGKPVLAHWSIAEPSTDAEFAHVADEIDDRVAVLLAELLARPTEREHRD